MFDPPFAISRDVRPYFGYIYMMRKRAPLRCEQSRKCYIYISIADPQDNTLITEVPLDPLRHYEALEND